MTYRNNPEGLALYIKRSVTKTASMYLILIPIALIPIYFTIRDYENSQMILGLTASMSLLISIIGIVGSIPRAKKDYAEFSLSMQEDVILFNRRQKQISIDSESIVKIAIDSKDNIKIHTKYKGQYVIASTIQNREEILEKLKLYGHITHENESSYLIQYSPYLFLVILGLVARKYGPNVYILVGSLYLISAAVSIVNQIRRTGVRVKSLFSVLFEGAVAVYICKNIYRILVR